MRWGAALSILLLAGCGAFDDPAITDCEAYLKAKLKAPSTYKRIKASGVEITQSKPTYYQVIIDYDAANSFGVPLRGMQVCKYPMKNGSPDTSDYIDHDGAARAMANDDVDALIGETEAAADKAASGN